MRVRRQFFSSLFACFLLCSVVLWLSSTAPVMAQSTNTGTLVGNRDRPDWRGGGRATVTVTDAATKTSRTDATNQSGRYMFVDVAPGAYDVTVTKQGFSTSKTANHGQGRGRPHGQYGSASRRKQCGGGGHGCRQRVADHERHGG